MGARVDELGRRSQVDQASFWGIPGAQNLVSAAHSGEPLVQR